MNTANTLPPDLIRVGHLMAPQGLKGAIKLFVVGETEQLLKLRRLYVESLGWRRIASIQAQGQGVTVQLLGTDTREAALELRGLEVQDAAGMRLGEVQDVLDMGFQDVLVVSHSGGSALLPLQAPYVVVKRGLAVVLDGAPEGLIGGQADTVKPSRESGLEDGPEPG